MAGALYHRTSRPATFPVATTRTDLRACARIPHAGKRKFKRCGPIASHCQIQIIKFYISEFNQRYILGVNFVLSFYPRDVATVTILM